MQTFFHGSVADRLAANRAERDDIKLVYGWVQPIQSHNPFVIVFRSWGDLLRDLKRARTPRRVAGYPFGPAGRQPEGKGPTTENLRKLARNEARKSVYWLFTGNMP